jgi:hypothetical protein
MLAMQLAAKYSDLLVQLMMRAKPVHTANADIAIQSSLLARVETETNRILSELTRIAESGGSSNQPKEAALHQGFEFQRTQGEKFAAQRAVLFDQKNTAHVVYLRSYMRDMAPIVDEQLRLQVLMRRELGLHGDIDALRKATESIRKDLFERVEAAIAELSGKSPSVPSGTTPHALK